LRKTIYYTDELNEDFAENGIKTKKIPADFVYLHREWYWRAAATLIYRVIAWPIVFLFVKVVYLQRFRNRKVMRKISREGGYLYANHTNALLDVYTPYIVRVRRRNYIVAGPDAFSIPGICWLVQMLGGIPLGSTIAQEHQMRECVQERVRDGNLVTVFPEAHIWPYYTRIRPYRAATFHYPAQDGAAVYTMTHCYRKRKIGRYVKVDTYLDGPFYADMSLPLPQRRQELRDRCYEAMCRRAEAYSDYAYWTYVRKETEKEKTEGDQIK